LIERVTGEARNLIGMLNGAAGFTDSRENSLSNVLETCERLKPTANAALLLPAAPGQLRYGSVMDAIQFCATRARQVNREILELSAFVPSDVIRRVVEIENYSHFYTFDQIYPVFQRGDLKIANIKFLGRGIFDYLLLADRVDDYRRKFLPPTTARPSGLVAGTELESDAVPLKRSINTATVQFLRPSRVPPAALTRARAATTAGSSGVVSLGGDGRAFDVAAAYAACDRRDAPARVIRL
jgi:hypothetical protein